MKISPGPVTGTACQNRFLPPLLCSAIILLQALLTEDLQANVYASNIRFNGGSTNVAVPAITNINISYILNEPASSGVVINIKSGATLVRSISITNPNPGTLRGTNLVAWDGKDPNGVTVGAGTYTFSITASTTGYQDWTQITDDANPGNYVYEGRGIAVNKNANSLYYGRVFVGNSQDNPAGVVRPGDATGILILNADGSPADEAQTNSWNNTGGWNWAGDGWSPWKLEVSDDDKLYVNDWTASGIVLSFDQTLSEASRRIVLNTNNYPSINVSLSGPFITGTGADTKVWMADTYSEGVGIRRWAVSANGSVATNDTGTTIVLAGTSSDLKVAPFDVALDRSNRIYTIQKTESPSDPVYRVLRFPVYTGTAETNADWKIGSGDDTMQGAFGIAVDPTGRYLAAAFVGANGSTRVFEATNGASVVTSVPTTAPSHTDVAWDNVGNLYTIANIDEAWRAFSPPGTNQATTTATVTIQIGGGGTPPTLSAPSYSAGQFQFTLNGQPDATYLIQASTNFQNWDVVATNTSPNASRSVSVSAPARATFYRAVIP